MTRNGLGARFTVERQGRSVTMLKNTDRLEPTPAQSAKRNVDVLCTFDFRPILFETLRRVDLGAWFKGIMHSQPKNPGRRQCNISSQ